MAIPFTAYPVPPQEPDQPHPVAQVADRLQRMMGMLGEYQLQKQALDQQKELARQQRVLEFLKLKGEYGDEAVSDAASLGFDIPKPVAGAMATTPVASPAPANAPTFGPPPTPPATPAPVDAATPAAAAPTAKVSSPLDITPDYLANLRKTKGTKGSERFMKEQEFISGQKKTANEIEQNTPYSPNQVRSALSVFGEDGKNLAESMIAASPNGVPRAMFSNAMMALGQKDRTAAQQSKWQWVTNPATGEGTWVKPPAPGGPAGAPSQPTATSVPVTAPYTPAQKQVDDTYAKEYSDYVLKGGYAEAQKQISNLDQAIQRIQANPDVSGRMIGLLPQKGRALVSTEAAGVERAVRDTIVKSLRQTFGPQFTEGEGERLIANTYNPMLPAAENIRSLQSLQSQLSAIVKAKSDAARYYEKNGTLAGYKGQTSFSMSDLMPSTSAATNNGSPAPRVNPAPGAGQGLDRYQQAIAAAQEALRVNPNDEKAKRTLQIAQRKLAEGGANGSQGVTNGGF